MTCSAILAALRTGLGRVRDDERGGWCGLPCPPDATHSPELLLEMQYSGQVRLPLAPCAASLVNPRARSRDLPNIPQVHVLPPLPRPLQIQDGQMHGKGALIYPNGERYEGSWCVSRERAWRLRTHLVARS